MSAKTRLLSTPLQALRNQDLKACLKLLSDPYLQSPHLTEWSAGDMDQLRWSLVAWRDQGRVDEAIEGLRLAARLWPREAIFVLELLVIRDSGRPHLDISLIDNAPSSVRQDPGVALFLCLDAARRGNAEPALSFLSDLDDQARRKIEPFGHQCWELLKLTLLPIRRDDLHSALGRGSDAARETEALIDTLGESFVYADRVGQIREAVREWAFINSHQIPNPTTLTLATLERVASQLSVTGNVARLALLVALDRLDEANRLARSLIDVEGAAKSGWLSRTVATLAARQRDAVLERKALSRFDPRTDLNEGNLEAARSVEILRRRHLLGADRALNVFVGLFGQMRDPEYVLPPMIEHLSDGFKKSDCGPFNLTFGLSTWAITGSRPLSLNDSWHFFFQLMPPPMRPMMTDAYGYNGHKLATVFPHLIDAMIRHTATKRAREPTLTELAALLPEGVSLQIDSEGPFEARVRQALTQGAAEEGWAHINQFKLWSRISALKHPLAEQEARLGNYVDACLFMRCDLSGLQGQLAELACRVASPYGSDIVFNDYDPHADYIEGAGDRYLVVSRRGAEVLFGGLEEYIGAYDGTGSAELRPRINCHEGPHSLFFSNGLTPIPAGNFHFEIHRGIVPISVILPALHQDLAIAKSPVREFIQSAIDTLLAEA